LLLIARLEEVFLSGKYKSINDLDEKDFRRNISRFQGENWEKNMLLVNELNKIAQEKGCPISQIAIAWVLQNEGMVTIPGTKSVKYLLENLGSENVELTDEDNLKIREILKTFPVVGDRNTPEGMTKLDL